MDPLREDAMTAIETRRFDEPDQILDMKERGGISILRMADGSTGMHAIFEPGWTWEADEKPLLGSPDSCPMQHTGYSISGHLVVRMIETGARLTSAQATSSISLRAMTPMWRVRREWNSSSSPLPNTSIEGDPQWTR
jgi:hypothetical protein